MNATTCTAKWLKGTVHSKNKCGLIERVLGTDSNEPSLASIRELEPSQKDVTRRHVIHITWQLMTYVLLSSWVASVSDVEFAADIYYFLHFPEKHLFGVFLVRCWVPGPRSVRQWTIWQLHITKSYCLIYNSPSLVLYLQLEYHSSHIMHCFVSLVILIH